MAPKRVPAAPAIVDAGEPSRPKKTHPPMSIMVIEAIKELDEPKGSSVQAIKKAICARYPDVDFKRGAFHFKKYLTEAVENGVLLQPKGRGASGSFKISKAAKPKPKAVKPAVAKPSAAPAEPKQVKKSEPAMETRPKAVREKKPKEPEQPVVEKKTRAAVSKAPVASVSSKKAKAPVAEKNVKVAAAKVPAKRAVIEKKDSPKKGKAPPKVVKQPLTRAAKKASASKK